MTGIPAFDWILLSVSLFNVILMLWLGCTVLFNAGQRTPAGRTGRWGFWLAGSNLFLGAVFFALHTAVLSLGWQSPFEHLGTIWRAGWFFVSVLPFSWYSVILWYGGFWEDADAPLARRHRPWFIGVASVFSLWLVWILAFEPVPALLGWYDGESMASPALGGIPLSLFPYPPLILLCTVLAFDVLRRPGPTARLMGTQARARARPWLAAASLSLLAVCLLVSLALATALQDLAQRSLSRNDLVFISALDLAIAGLIALATILLGQSVVAYEVFTGRILPRRGLTMLWRYALVLAAGFSLTAGGFLAFHILPVYGLLVSAMMMTAFVALLGWRTYAEREGFLDTMRPFVSSQQLYDRLTRPSNAPAETDAAEPFAALCRELLDTRRAALAAIGPMGPLWGNPLTYPEPFQTDLPMPEWDTSIRGLAIPLAPGRTDGLMWAVPLWSGRGPIGTLLLADKRNGALYTQEDLEIAQAVCERLIDTHASAELARRLFALQRERLVGSQVLDRKTRRVLHDDVLPSLHAALLDLSAQTSLSSEHSGLVQTLAEIHRRISDLLREIPSAAPSESSRLGLLGSLRFVLDEELQDSFEEVAWEIDPAAEQAVVRLPAQSLDVVFYAAREAMRNAAKYGRGGDDRRSLRLRIALKAKPGLELVMEDNGVGFRADAALSGSGHGLALHSTMMAVIGGELRVESTAGSPSRIRLLLPPE